MWLLVADRRLHSKKEGSLFLISPDRAREARYSAAAAGAGSAGSPARAAPGGSQSVPSSPGAGPHPTSSRSVLPQKVGQVPLCLTAAATGRHGPAAPACHGQAMRGHHPVPAPRPHPHGTAAPMCRPCRACGRLIRGHRKRQPRQCRLPAPPPRAPILIISLEADNGFQEHCSLSAR